MQWAIPAATGAVLTLLTTAPTDRIQWWTWWLGRRIVPYTLLVAAIGVGSGLFGVLIISALRGGHVDSLIAHVGVGGFGYALFRIQVLPPTAGPAKDAAVILQLLIQHPVAALEDRIHRDLWARLIAMEDAELVVNAMNTLHYVDKDPHGIRNPQDAAKELHEHVSSAVGELNSDVDGTYQDEARGRLRHAISQLVKAKHIHPSLFG